MLTETQVIDSFLDEYDKMLLEDQNRIEFYKDFLSGKRAVQFKSKGGLMIIFHPSVDGGHNYQVTFFGKLRGSLEALSDARRNTLSEIGQVLAEYGELEAVKIIEEGIL